MSAGCAGCAGWARVSNDFFHLIASFKSLTRNREVETCPWRRTKLIDSGIYCLSILFMIFRFDDWRENFHVFGHVF